MIYCTASGLENSMSLRRNNEARDSEVFRVSRFWGLQVDPILRPKAFVVCDCQLEEYCDELDGKFGQGVFVSVEYGGDSD